MATSLRKPLRVLISGAGISGPVLAYWLGKAGVSVTVVERADRLRKEGQTIDINDEARIVMKYMGVEAAIRKVTTKEVGTKFVDAENRVCAAFPFSTEKGQIASPTNEFEIVRGQLSQVFYEVSKENAEYVFGDTIAAIEETGSSVKVTFAKDGKSREFDIVVVTEGLASRTRALAFGEDIRAPLKPLDMWIISFSFAQGKNDDQWSRLYNAPQRRGLWLRPDGFGRVRVNAMFIGRTEATRTMASSRDRKVLNEYIANIFKDAGWETDRIMAGLRDADDLYVQEVAQAKCKTWSKGRVVLVGDTAYCPSPLSGGGCTAAMVGSYVLAAEIVQHQDDHRAAFEAYETLMRPWIESNQNLLPGVPNIGLPETRWGIRVLHVFAWIMSVAARIGVFNVIGRIFGFFSSDQQLKLPDPSVFARR